MASSIRAKLLTLSLTLAGDRLPTEFRLFKAGENETTKGAFLFDAKAAEMVMSAWKAQSVDLAIDLEHLALDQESNAYDPDARGWFGLEVRNGELWAVNVTWTPDGARRLTEKTQRYVSPAFQVDDENRITEILNVALVAMPATHGTPALVAAGRRHTPMTLAQRLALIAQLSVRLATARTAMVKLAEGEGEAPSGKFAAIQAAAVKASEALAALENPGGVDEGMAAIDAAKAAVDEFAAAVAAMAGGAPVPAPAPEAMADDADKEKTEQMARDRAELQTLRAEKARAEQDRRVEKLAAEKVERHGLVAALVRLGRETPATAWTDETATTPKGYLGTMPIVELRQRVKDFGGVPNVTLGGPRTPNGDGSTVTGGGHVSVLSEDEVTYVKARHSALATEGMRLRSVDDTIGRLTRLKSKQLAGATLSANDGLAKSLAARMDRRVISLAHRAGLITLSSPVQPFDELGASSQIALQTFGLEYNLALASAPSPWAEVVGRRLPDGSLKTTYPINFRALRFQERTATNAAAGQPLNADVEVKKKEFFEGQMLELKRLRQGDFAYVQSWGQLAGDLARARLALGNELVTALIEAGTSGYWGQTASQATGIDGQAFWSDDHMVNPFDASMELRGSATWSNYQSSAKPLTAANLTAQKSLAKQVAAPDGREVNIKYDGILLPSALEETAVNLLTVQQVVLNAASTLEGVSDVFGGVTNPHFQSGLQITTGQELAGTDATANYYLYSREGIARGLFPWVISEDPTEELRQWDETSDFYKGSGFIKWESHVWLNAVLLFPHAIRYVKGA